MQARAKIKELRAYLGQPEDQMPVRAMALICFASAGLLLFGLLFNADDLPVSKEKRLFTTSVTTFAGILYWAFSKRFRAWMLHLIITLGLVWGCLGLAQMSTEIGSAMTILTIFWTCLLIGSTFRPAVARIYGGFVFVGLTLALRSTSISAPENALMAVGFGVTMIVTMELLSQVSSRLRDEALRDPLTGLLNRKGLREAAARAVRVGVREHQPLAIVSLDLHDFKALNDREGHLAGDRMLVRCAESWRANLRPQDVLARPGGDEFVLLLPAAEMTEAETTLQRLAAVSPVAFSYGIAIARPGDSIEAKLSEADAVLIRSKAELHRPMPEAATS